MRPRVLVVLVVALVATGTLSLTACGGDPSGDVAPKSTPDLTVPNGADALARDASGSTTSTTSTTDTTDTTSTGTATTAPDTSAPTDTGAAPAQPQSQEPAPSSTTGGASPQTQGGGTGGAGGAGTTGGGTGGAGDFNQFCQDNPGACPGN
jgi:hypothetical protein